MSRIKDLVRPVRDILFTLAGFLYDFARFFLFAGHGGRRTSFVIRYRLIKIYHSLEKSLSFRERNQRSGWGVASELARRLPRTDQGNGVTKFHRAAAVRALAEFASSSNYDCAERSSVLEALRSEGAVSLRGSTVSITSDNIAEGKLVDPERFFLSRHSVRDFDPRGVEPEILQRAVQLAMKSPSACNRQPWHVYSLFSRSEIDEVLSHQSGNKGFGHEIPCLLLITADLQAFDNAGERYQHWIDGGMFSMSLIYALHALGVSSCCLNWSKGVLADLRLRRAIEIPNEHTLVMMIGIGYPNKQLKVCSSPREGVESILSPLKLRSTIT